MLKNIAVKVQNNWPSYRLAAFSILALLTLGWTLFDWSKFQLLREQTRNIGFLGLGLVVTEACFITGALIVAASLGIQVAHGQRLAGWFRHVRNTRRDVKQLLRQTTSSWLFGLGFWLNLFGALGTSLLLADAVIHYLPFAGWGILLFLVIDLVATLGLRIPIHRSRMQLKRSAKISVRQATQNDVEGYLELQAERWTEDNMANREQLESRLRSYPKGMLVAERGGEIVGMVYAMRVKDYDPKRPTSWNETTRDGFCDNADPEGKAIFGVDLSTRTGVGHLAGDKLLLGIGQLAISEGVESAYLGGRLPGYHKYSNHMSAEQYLWAKTDHGKPLDKQVSFYTKIPGLDIVSAIPDYFNDPESLNYGVLLRWRNPMYKLPGRKFWARLLPILVRI